MTSSFPFFQPTFTQGLIIGQLSILVLLGMVLKYLFLETSPYPYQTPSYHHQVDNDTFLRQKKFHARNNTLRQDPDAYESTEWFNTLLKEVRINSWNFFFHLIQSSGRGCISLQTKRRCPGNRRRWNCPQAYRGLRKFHTTRWFCCKVLWPTSSKSTLTPGFRTTLSFTQSILASLLRRYITHVYSRLNRTVHR